MNKMGLSKEIFEVNNNAGVIWQQQKLWKYYANERLLEDF